MDLPTHQGTFYDINVVYYVFFSLLIVNSLLYYIFNGYILGYTKSRDCSWRMSWLVLFIDVG